MMKAERRTQESISWVFGALCACSRICSLLLLRLIGRLYDAELDLGSNVEGERSPVARLVDANASTVAKAWGQMEGPMCLNRTEKLHMHLGIFRPKASAGSRVRPKLVMIADTKPRTISY